MMMMMVSGNSFKSLDKLRDWFWRREERIKIFPALFVYLLTWQTWLVISQVVGEESLYYELEPRAGRFSDYHMWFASELRMRCVGLMCR